MGIDHARHHNPLAAIDHFRPWILLLQGLPCSDGANPIALDVHAGALQNFAALVHGDQPPICEDEAHSVVPPVDALVSFIVTAIIEAACKRFPGRPTSSTTRALTGWRKGTPPARPSRFGNALKPTRGCWTPCTGSFAHFRSRESSMKPSPSRSACSPSTRT